MSPSALSELNAVAEGQNVGASTKPLTLETPNLRLGLNGDGELTEFIHLATDHNYANGRRLWRLFVEKGQHFQEEAVATETPPSISHDVGTLRVEFASLQSRKLGPLAIRLIFHVHLIGDEARWSIQVENDTPDVVVKEIQFPLMGAINLRSDEGLITTQLGGQRYSDPRRIVRDSHPITRHWYQCADHESLQVQLVYPGSEAAGNCFIFPGVEHGLYFGSHDSTFRNTLHLWRLDGKQLDQLETGFAKHLFTRPGETMRLDGYVISAYTGTWHVAADKYRCWTDTWFHPEPRPDWMRGYNGWQRIILKHQNGDILFPYDSFPQIFADGAKAGITSLFLFAWWPGGMDRMYPEYVADPEMGGEGALRENIRLFQENLGGSVILYASGRLVDRTSKFFSEKGHRLAVKTRSGADARDAYLFGNAGTYERIYGAVELTPMCLDCPEWLDVLKRVIDQAIDFGCKAVFFDQLGLQEHPCYDPTHGHPVPYVTQAEGKRRALGELRAYARSRDPQLAVGVEVFADAVCQYFDFVHGLYHQSYLARNPDYQSLGERPRYPGFVDWTRYVFPSVLISDRDIRDRNDVERRVNHALLLGLVNDVEIYRCRKTIAEIPHYQDWLGRVNALRVRHLEILAPENYRDTLGFTVDSPEVEARAFVAGERMAILLTQSHLSCATTTLGVPGYRFLAADRIGNAESHSSGDNISVTLGRHAVALVLLARVAQTRKNGHVLA